MKLDRLALLDQLVLLDPQDQEVNVVNVENLVLLDLLVCQE